MNFKVKVSIVVEPDEGGYYAHCPDLKGVHVSGETEGEALQNAVQAVKLYLLSMVKHDEPIPVGMLDRPTVRQKIGDLFAALIHATPPTYVTEIAVAV